MNLLHAFPGNDPTCNRIPLTQGQATLVDDEDYGRMSQHKWFANWDPNTESFYADRKVWRGGKQTTLRAHREIMSLEHGDPRDVHHVNGDTLDNRRENLEVVTKLEHANEHRNDPRKDVSPYGIGVYRRSNGRFRVQVRVAGKKHNIGTFDTAQEARDAREAFLKEARARLMPETIA